MRPAKIQISLRIRAVWSESSLGAFWIAKDAISSYGLRDSDQIARMRSLFGTLVRRYVFSRWGPNVLLKTKNNEYVWAYEIDRQAN